MRSFALGTTLLAGSSLSFIGLGAQPPAPEWGAMLATGRTYFDTAWWLAVFPGVAITALVLGLNLLGDGLRDLLDPKPRASRVRRERLVQDALFKAAPEANPVAPPVAER